MISIIIPAFNEAKNLNSLFSRIKKSMLGQKHYEIIIVDDHSNDGTWELLQNQKSQFPLKMFKKTGKKGKAFSLVEGFEEASGDILVMIDADLQYPPEAISSMLTALEKADVVVANRKNYNGSGIRRATSKAFRLIFGKIFFGLNCDIQSGLKVMKREVWNTVKFNPKSPWTFDLEFLQRAKEAGFNMQNIDITFDPRKNGESKINLFKTAWEIGTNALLLKTRRIHPQSILPKVKETMLGAGVAHKRRQYITHTTLHHSQSALKNLLFWQKAAIGILLIAAASSFYFSPQNTAIVIVAILSAVYFIDVIFNLFLIARSLHSPPEITIANDQLSSINDQKLPIYTILCPLYKEAKVLPHFLNSLKNIDWPKEKLDVILLLEEDDKETQDVAANLNLPAYVRTLVVPHSLPKTKPKACNFGLGHAKGEYLVIYDAEDIPEPQQLKKAYLAFAKAGPKTVCLQAKLNYHNSSQNLLTRFFTAEYSLWFDIILTGLQSVGTTIPLGGTSNHFRAKDLKSLEAWDPFNVTEDADLGIRLFKKGYKTAIIDSVTLEEANSKLGNWIRQRSRWIKGYMQTYLVHMRNPVEIVKTHGIHAVFFQLILGGKIAFMFINPILWATTISYFVFRSTIGPTIESLYPPIVFYMALVSLVFGNFLFMYYYMIGCAKREHWSLVKYVFFIPFYWLAISFAATIALYQLIVKPHYWEKTVHGLHLAKGKDEKKEETVTQEAEIPARLPQPALGLSKSILTSASILILASLAGNFFNFLYNAYLGRKLSIEDFGLISLVGSFLYLSTIPVSALSKTVTHRSAFLFGKYNTPAKGFWHVMRKKAFLAGFAFTLFWIAGAPLLSQYFKAPSLEPFYLFAPAWVVGLLLAVDGGFLSGNHKFKAIALITFAEPLIRLAIAYFLVEANLSRYVYAATPFSMTFSLLTAWVFASRISHDKIVTEKKLAVSFPTHFFASAVFARIAIFAFLSFDLILVKHYLPPKEAGEYALLSLVGKMIYFVSSLFSQFMNPFVSKAVGEAKETSHIFYKLLSVSTLAGVAAFLTVGYFGYLTVPLLLGEKTSPILKFLPIYSFSMLCFSIASTVVLFYQVRKKYLLSFVTFLLAMAQVVGIYTYHSNLAQIVDVMAITGIASVIVIFCLHLVYEPISTVARNIRDFFGLFSLQIPQKQNTQALNILIFNWRDTKHVWGGGAEVYIHELSKELIKKGHLITLFCGKDGKSKRRETIDGVEIIRRGGFYTVYVWAFLYYVFKFRNKFDIIADCENGIPFFTPLFVKKPIVCLIHHVHQEVFRKNLAFPFSSIARFLEGKLMPFVYRNIQIVTVSNSSKEDIEKLGLGKNKSIQIIHPGVDLEKLKPQQKTPNPSIVYLGRLQPYKSIETAIYAIEKVVKNIPSATLTIAGDGKSKNILENLTRQRGLTPFVKFVGKVSDDFKTKLLGKSWVMIQPSTMEGWGITAIEANAAGTPVVASNVPGLRDSVQNPHTGYLVPVKDSEMFAQKLELIINDKGLRKELEKNSLEWAKNFSWQKSAQGFSEILENVSIKNKIQ